MTVVTAADELGQYLGATVVGLVLGQNLFVGRIPSQPDACTAVYESGGAQPLLVLTGPGRTPEIKIDQPTFQLRVRDIKYDDAMTTMWACFKALQGVTEQYLIVGGAAWKLLYALQSPVNLGRDDLQRHEFSVNFRALYENPNR